MDQAIDKLRVFCCNLILITERFFVGNHDDIVLQRRFRGIFYFNLAAVIYLIVLYFVENPHSTARLITITGVAILRFILLKIKADKFLILMAIIDWGVAPLVLSTRPNMLLVAGSFTNLIPLITNLFFLPKKYTLLISLINILSIEFIKRKSITIYRAYTQEEVLDFMKIFFDDMPRKVLFSWALCYLYQVSIPNYGLRRDNKEDDSIIQELNVKLSNIEEKYKNLVKEHDETLKNLELANSIIQECQKNQEIILTNVSHEIKNPLNSIIGNIELMLATSTNTTDISLVCTIKHSAELLLHAINNIIDANKAFFNKLELNNEHCSMQQLIQTIWETASYKIIEKGLKGRLLISKNMPSVLVLDMKKIMRILMNLIMNSIKFTNHGGFIEIKFDWKDNIDTNEDESNGINHTCNNSNNLTKINAILDDAQALLYKLNPKANMEQIYRISSANIGLSSTSAATTSSSGNGCNGSGNGYNSGSGSSNGNRCNNGTENNTNNVNLRANGRRSFKTSNKKFEESIFYVNSVNNEHQIYEELPEINGSMSTIPYINNIITPMFLNNNNTMPSSYNNTNNNNNHNNIQNTIGYYNMVASINTNNNTDNNIATTTNVNNNNTTINDIYVPKFIKDIIAETYIILHTDYIKNTASPRSLNKFGLKDKKLNHATKSTKGYLKIEIIDTGCGISKETLKDMFQMFYQGDNTSTRKYEGAGLGLYVVKKYIDHMKGHIKVHSEKDVGSNFIVLIPSLTGSATDNDIDTIKLPLDVPYKQYKILVVEDNKANQVVLKNYLNKLGFDVTLCNNGKEGFQEYISQEEGYYKLITLDIQMPEIDGITCIKMIRKYEKTNNFCKPIPAIFISANCSLEEKTACLNPHGEIKALAFLEKPLSFSDCQKIIHKIITEAF